MIVESVAAVIAGAGFFLILRGLTKRNTDTVTAPQEPASPKSSRKSRGLGGTSRTASENEKAGADYAEDFLALSGNADRAKEIPAWAMLLQSPLNPPPDPGSWIGGTPKAPESFLWPSTAEGKRQHFLAQIDLGALSGADHQSLPSEGALLVFFAYQWTDDKPDHVYRCHFLTAAEMKEARELPVPDDLEPLDQSMGFFHPDQTFIKRGVDLVPFLDDGTSPPAGVRQVFDTPELWISNWGLALLEAEITLKQLENCIEPLLGQRGEQHLADLHKQSAKMPNAAYILTRISDAQTLASQGPKMLETLAGWRDLAKSKPPGDPIDRGALNALFAERTSLSEQLKHSIAPLLKQGAHAQLWLRLRSSFPDTPNTDAADPEWEIYREFFDQKATGWRGHRLFGIEPPFDNNWEDLRGQDCVISIRGDTLLGTMSEHFYGVSIWCPRDKLANGKLDGGQVVRHCAV